MKTSNIASSIVSVCLTLIIVAGISINLQAKSLRHVENNVPVLSVKEQLAQAKKDGKAVFLLITGTGATGVDAATKTANDAKAKYAKSVVITINKDDAANSEVVAKLGIASVPLPFFLVISPKGMAVAGYTVAQATADLLVKAIPSPKQDEVLLAISEKKPVFIVVSKKGLTDKTTSIANCKSASAKVASKPAVVEFDINDSKETAFLKQMGVTTVGEKTITVVANASGQITDRYEGPALETALIASANKVIKSGGCCPGGSTNGCAPKK